MAYVRVLNERKQTIREFGFNKTGKKRAKELAQRLADKSKKRHFVAECSDSLEDMRYENPGGKHLPGASRKENRQYEHVLQSELARGYGVKRAKSIAAATVRKGQKQKRRSRRSK